ncbi:MAG: shikimate dehydrogenase [bacterium]
MKAAVLDAIVTGKTRVVGIFGWPVRHSLSPPMQNAAFRAAGLDYVYIPFAIPPAKLGESLQLLAGLGIAGVNLTVPHKESAIPYLHKLSKTARRVGAVNTVRVLKNGNLEGHNTDVIGFAQSLQRDAGFKIRGKSALLIGAGGAARAVGYALASGGAAKVTIVNRTAQRAYNLAVFLRSVARKNLTVQIVEPGEASLAEEIAQADLVVNATSLGLKVSDPVPISLRGLRPKTLVFDTIYNPSQTRLLKAARAKGCKTCNGLGMLARQGAASFKIWTGRDPDLSLMMKTLRRCLSRHP